MAKLLRVSTARPPVTAVYDPVKVTVPATPASLMSSADALVTSPAPSVTMRPAPVKGPGTVKLKSSPATVNTFAPVGIESTVVAIEGGKLRLLRPGMISLGEIEQAAAQVGGVTGTAG